VRTYSTSSMFFVTLVAFGRTELELGEGMASTLSLCVMLGDLRSAESSGSKDPRSKIPSIGARKDTLAAQRANQGSFT
jgi:hypothetical protein